MTDLEVMIKRVKSIKTSLNQLQQTEDQYHSQLNSISQEVTAAQSEAQGINSQLEELQQLKKDLYRGYVDALEAIVDQKINTVSNLESVND